MSNGQVPSIEAPFSRPPEWIIQDYAIDGDVLVRAVEILQAGGTIDDIMKRAVATTDPAGTETFPNVSLALSQYGLPTTGVPRDAGNLRPYKERWLADRQIDNLANNLLDFTRTLPAYEQLGELQHMRRILHLFGSVKDARFDNVHLQDARTTKGKKDGTVVFGHTQLVVETEAEAIELDGILSEWLQAENPNDSKHNRHVNHRTISRGDTPDSYVVDIHNMNEFDWHMLEIGCERLMARWLEATIGTVLPINKGTLKDWIQLDGETFNPRALAVLQKVVDDYQRMKVGLGSKVTYGGDYADTQPAIDENPFGTAPAAIFEIARKVRNGIIRPYLLARQGNNPVQHDNKKRRLRIERNVSIRRTRIDHSIRPRAPGPVHATKLHERGADKLREAREDTRGIGIEIAYRLGSMAIGGIGLLELGLDLIKAVAPKGARTLATEYKSITAWREQRGATQRHTQERIVGPLVELLRRNTQSPATTH
jgi:hypothetical protein